MNNKLTNKAIVEPIPPTDEELIGQLEAAGFKKVAKNSIQLLIHDIDLCIEVNPSTFIVGQWDMTNESVGIEIPCKSLASAVKLALCLVEVVK